VGSDKGAKEGDPVTTEGRVLGEGCVLPAADWDEAGRWWVCPGFWANPALMAMDVCMHRWNGDVCIITLCLRFLLSPALLAPSFASGISSSVSRLRKILAMRAPRALDCVQPP
jgi:hypothetical protein